VKDKKDILIFSPNAYCGQKVDGKHVNRVHEPYANALRASTLMVEKSHGRRFHEPRAFENTCYLDQVIISAGLRSKFRSAKDSALPFIKFLRKHFENELSEESYHFLQRRIEELSVRMPHYLHSLQKVFRKLQPKKVFVNCACYGGDSYITFAAKELGIPVAEIQHSALFRNHLYYSFGKTLRESLDFQKNLPDHFLTWGPGWHEAIASLPVNKVPIGHPKNSATYASSPKAELMVISQGPTTQELIPFVKELSKVLPNFTINFRLHPAEQKDSSPYASIASLPNVRLGGASPLYQDLKAATAVLGSFSTILWEAMLFKKPVFIFDHYWSRLHMDDRLGHRTKDPRDIARRLKESSLPEIPCPSQYWQENWQEHYLNFVTL